MGALKPKDFVRLLLIALVYFGAAKLGFTMAFAAEQVTLVWPPTGIALAAVLFLGYRVWPGISAGAFLANLTTGAPVLTAAGIAIGNTLEAVTGAWLLSRFVGFRRNLESFRDVLALILLAAGVSTMVSATIGVTSLCLGQLEPWERFAPLWVVWWLGDAMGDLVVAPVLLTFPTWTRQRWGSARSLEAAALFFSVLALSQIAFGRLSPEGPVPVEYAIFPFVIWAALRFGPPGTAGVTFIVSAVAVWGTIDGSGPFIGQTVNESLFLLLTFLAAVAGTSLLLAAVTSERAAALRQADDANRAKDEFLGMLAHELRNPLAPLRNALEVLGSDPEGPRVAWAKPILERQVRHLSRLVDDLLDVSRITRGKIELRKEPVNLLQALDHAVEASRPLIEARKHVLHFSKKGGDLILLGDVTRLEQIFVNLLNNAAKYTNPGGKVWVSADRDGNEAVVAIRDSGIGIRADLLSRVFDLFTQADRSLARSEGGLGLGLTLVRNLVLLHGGTVRAHSEGLGKGSEFTVRFPLISLPAEVRPQEPMQPSTVREEPKRILVVEDSLDSAESLKLMLELFGHEVEMVHDGPSALEAVRTFRPAVIFLDIGLPGMDGYEVARRLRAQGYKMFLIALTGYGRDSDRQLAREAGFDHHLVKPVDPDVLEKLLA